jgi:FtsH-binding integral membrane protein
MARRYRSDGAYEVQQGEMVYQRGFTSGIRVTEAGRQLLLKTYMWMFAALALTGLVSMYVMSTSSILDYFRQQPGVLIGLIVFEVVLVFFLAARIHALSLPVAGGILFLYAGLNGVTLSPILNMYTSASLTQTFFITAGTFAVTSIYGYTTKRDLTGVGHFAIMGLIGIILAGVVNLFMGSPALSFGISVIGVLVFTLLMAYDTQMIVQMGEAAENQPQIAVYGALSLYLDFINLFLILLRLFGSRD